MKNLSKKLGITFVITLLVLAILPTNVFAGATGDSYSSVANIGLQLNAATEGIPGVAPM